jgi:hypothetical protein
MNLLTNLALLVKQLDVNTTMVDSSTQLGYIEHCNKGAKLNDGAKKNILTIKKKQPRHSNREPTMMVSETNYSAMFDKT